MRELFIHTAQDRMMGKTHPAEQKKGSLLLTYAMERPKKDSSLVKINDLFIEKAKGVWGQEHESMISLVYKHETPEELKK